MTGNVLQMYKDVENGKLAKIISIGEKEIFAASCPTFGDKYKAMMIIQTTDEEGNAVKYRYDLLSGKQILIEGEYSSIPAKELRQIETVLATTYIGNVSEKVHSFYENMLYQIDRLNQNTPDWNPILEDSDYKEIPKFSNKRKPAKKASKEE